MSENKRMIPIEYEIDRLRNLTTEMIELVKEQVLMTKETVITGDLEVAAEVMRKEARVNAYEISIDRECEDLFALQTPVATDLRFTMAALKISSYLERIGDHAYRICSFVYEEKIKPSKTAIDLLKLGALFDDINEMLVNSLEAFEKDDPKIAKKTFKKDKILNKANEKVPQLLASYSKKSQEKLEELILLARVIGKLERTGDLIKNICEEIIFYIESRVIKHRKKNKRIRKRFQNMEE